MHGRWTARCWSPVSACSYGSGTAPITVDLNARIDELERRLRSLEQELTELRALARTEEQAPVIAQAEAAPPSPQSRLKAIAGAVRRAQAENDAATLWALAAEAERIAPAADPSWQAYAHRLADYARAVAGAAKAPAAAEPFPARTTAVAEPTAKPVPRRTAPAPKPKPRENARRAGSRLGPARRPRRSARGWRRDVARHRLLLRARHEPRLDRPPRPCFARCGRVGTRVRRGDRRAPPLRSAARRPRCLRCRHRGWLCDPRRRDDPVRTRCPRPAHSSRRPGSRPRAWSSRSPGRPRRWPPSASSVRSSRPRHWRSTRASALREPRSRRSSSRRSQLSPSEGSGSGSSSPGQPSRCRKSPGWSGTPTSATPRPRSWPRW